MEVTDRPVEWEICCDRDQFHIHAAQPPLPCKSPYDHQPAT